MLINVDDYYVDKLERLNDKGNVRLDVEQAVNYAFKEFILNQYVLYEMDAKNQKKEKTQKSK